MEMTEAGLIRMLTKAERLADPQTLIDPDVCARLQSSLQNMLKSMPQSLVAVKAPIQQALMLLSLPPRQDAQDALELRLILGEALRMAEGRPMGEATPVAAAPVAAAPVAAAPVAAAPVAAAPVITEQVAASSVVPPSAPARPSMEPVAQELPAEEPSTPPDFGPELIHIFMTEAYEYIDAAETALLLLENDPNDMDSVNTVFRAFHTLKSGSAFFGLTAASELAHHAESLLSRVRDREIRFGGAYAEWTLRSIDMLKLLLAALPAGSTRVLPEGYDTLLRLLTGQDAHSAAPKAAQTAAAAPHAADSLPAVRAPRIDPVMPQAAQVPRASSTPALPPALALEKHGFDRATPEKTTPERTTADKPALEKHAVESFVKVRTDRLDQLIDMVGELVIAQSLVAQDDGVLLGGNLELQRKTAHAGKIVRELQNLSMSMRMIPMKATFQKMRRLVRDVALKIDKRVELMVEGEDTEIDRNMVDVISDPLMHMIRNGVDHGIESPADRVSRGKPAVGTIRLSACHAGGHVVIQMQDDGRGLDRSKLVKVAIARGLIESDAGMSDEDVYRLIFAPGFSTADKVTDVSGRGVGMDMVRQSIEALKGRIEIASALGEGTLFTVHLPLTLAITDGMLVRVGQERFIIPINSIHKSFRPESEHLFTYAGRGELVRLRGEIMPLMRLNRLFDLAGGVEDPRRGLLVVIEVAGRFGALLVDDLLGQQQVVARSLGEGLGQVPGIAGAAILGDGNAGLILDPTGLMTLARQPTAAGLRAAALAA